MGKLKLVLAALVERLFPPKAPQENFDESYIVIFPSMANRWYGRAWDLVFCKDHILRSPDSPKGAHEVKCWARLFETEEAAKTYARKQSYTMNLDLEVVRAGEFCREVARDSRLYIGTTPKPNTPEFEAGTVAERLCWTRKFLCYPVPLAAQCLNVEESTLVEAERGLNDRAQEFLEEMEQW